MSKTITITCDGCQKAILEVLKLGEIKSFKFLIEANDGSSRVARIDLCATCAQTPRNLPQLATFQKKWVSLEDEYDDLDDFEEEPSA